MNSIAPEGRPPAPDPSITELHDPSIMELHAFALDVEHLNRLAKADTLGRPGEGCLRVATRTRCAALKATARAPFLNVHRE
jgi:hypothetical protein